MSIIFDWLLIIVSSFLFYKSANRILSYKSSSVVDYVIVIIFVFNCVPIILDYTIGVPDYHPWLSYFHISIENEITRTVYSIYILLTIMVLSVYLNIYSKKKLTKKNRIYTYNDSIIFKKKLLVLLVISPFLHIILSGNLSNYFEYGTYASRGLENTFYHRNTFLLLISLFSFCCLFFSQKRYSISYIILLMYGLLVFWVDGKRYIIVTFMLMVLFFYLNSPHTERKKIPLKSIAIVFSVAFIFFNSIYLTTIKPTSSNSFDSLYMSYRVDFGRDDVTKFVIYKELIEKDPILDYRGQSVLSTVFMLVPRELWPSKPYPHYRYLTASLYGTSIFDIPAGMTPSLFEISIANFGVALGMFFTTLSLIFMCWWSDHCKSIPRKALYLLLIVGLLTQSLDAMLAYYIIAPVSGFLSLFKRSFERKYSVKGLGEIK